MKRTYLGVAYFLCVSVIMPFLIYMGISAKPLTSEAFFLLSFFISIVAIPMGIMLDMILVKGNAYEKNIEISSKTVRSKIVQKKVYDDSFQAPFFLFVINPAYWVMAKACEKSDKHYCFKVEVDGIKILKEIFVTKQQFFEYEEKDQLILNSKEMERQISVCWFEKLIMGYFQDTFYEKYTKYEIKSI